MHANLRNRIPLTCQEVERLLCELCSAHFGRTVSPYDDFFDLGGDSLSIIALAATARERGLPIRSSAALRYPTSARLAEHLTLPHDSGPRVRPPALDPGPGPAPAGPAADVRAVPIAEGDPARPLYVLHSHSHVRAERDAVATWAAGHAAFGFTLPGGTVAQLADRCVAALRDHRPAGALRLAGFGHGAVVAFEAARRLRGLGTEVELLALIGPPTGPDPDGKPADEEELLTRRLASLAGRFALTGDEGVGEIHARFRAGGWYEDVARPEDLPRLQSAWAGLARSVQEYAYPAYDGRAVLVSDGHTPHPAEQAWADAAERLTIHRLDLGLESLLPTIGDPRVADTMRRALEG